MGASSASEPCERTESGFQTEQPASSSETPSPSAQTVLIAHKAPTQMLTGDELGRSRRNSGGMGASGTPQKRRQTAGPGKCRGRDNTDLRGPGQGEINGSVAVAAADKRYPVEVWDEPEQIA